MAHSAVALTVLATFSDLPNFQNRLPICHD